ncbi:GM24653 [Drosophila sechellia]|uniref:GM24653 n=1 Tax=Drosophila sechellia TaxID=7238 RepID=B4HFN3_DROSE|nr:GM24653 [Drosophila sechellia]
MRHQNVSSSPGMWRLSGVGEEVMAIGYVVGPRQTSKPIFDWEDGCRDPPDRSAKSWLDVFVEEDEDEEAGEQGSWAANVGSLRAAEEVVGRRSHFTLNPAVKWEIQNPISHTHIPIPIVFTQQSGYVQEAKREIWDAMAHHRHRHHQHHHHGTLHWVDGRRVHRLRMPHPQRWSGRRRSINHHQPFSRWSQWSPCDEECVRRRERFCKVKRKCGHTKHVEQSKCSHCHPAPAIKWQPPLILDDSHIRERNQPLPQAPPQTQPPPPPPPSIIINAAAAASSGPTVDYRYNEYKPPPNYAPLYPSTHPPIYAPTYPADHHPTHLPTYPPPTHPPTPPPTPPNNSDEVVRHLPKYPGKDIFSEEDVEDELEPEPDEDLISSDEQGDFFVLKHRRHRRRQNHRRPSHRKPPKEEDYDDSDFVDFGERKSLRHRHLGEDSSVEGDVFQYEDFDLPDTMYADSEESEGEYRNITWVQPAKDGIALRRRRVYSKWSRWTKCSPKCTTRRYKKCRITDQCGREVLREIAYCYTEGSFCQHWLQTQFQKTPAYETRPGSGSMTGKGYRGPEYTPLKLNCGIVRSGTGRRSMSNMLKIIGGRAARKGEWPWQVAILNRFKEAFCGGTLIAPRWVLTAAHCVRKVLFVRIGGLPCHGLWISKAISFVLL